MSSLKLLGSKFFHEVQAGSKYPSRVKTYDVNAVFDDEPGSQSTEDDHAFVGEAWEEPDLSYDESDPDAIICMQFEESLCEAMPDAVSLIVTRAEVSGVPIRGPVISRVRVSRRVRVQFDSGSHWHRGFWSRSVGAAVPKGTGKQNAR